MALNGKAILELSDDVKRKLIIEYEQFERNGSIGDCQLRSLAEKMSNGGPNDVLWMNILANECYRYFANKYFDMISD